jgi:hypothetical protein
METLYFHIVGHSYQAHILYAVIGVNQPMRSDVFLHPLHKVKC